MGRTWMIDFKNGDLAYKEGLIEFFDCCYHNMKDRRLIPCPCCRCGNIQYHELPIIKIHLEKHPFSRGYTVWNFHGEDLLKSSDRADVDDDAMFESNDNMFVSNNGDDDDDDMFDESNDHMFVSNDNYGDDFTPKDADDGFQDDDGHLDEPDTLLHKLQDSELPLYTNCEKYTKLSAVVKLYNLKGSNGWSEKSFTDLLALLSDMLPDGNVLPTRTYEAKKMIKGLGLKYEKIHACINDCILYRGDKYKGETHCPVCGEWRYKNKEGIPAKVMWYFPIIPRFRRLFANSVDAKMLTWHKTREAGDGKLRHPADALQWKSFDAKYPDFGNESRNLRLALSTDGMNPHGNLSTQHSTWPVVLAIYNLPPAVCMKRKYLMLSILISGPKQPGNDIDIYLAPLLDDLRLLWEEGVRVFDSFKNEYFILRATLLCTITDFPAYGDLSGHTVHGKEACPLCGDDIESEYMKHSRKHVFLGHRRFLPRTHPYRRDADNFNGKAEQRPPPKMLNGFEVYKKVKNINIIYGKKSPKISTRGYKKKSAFFDKLPYWSDLPVGHCLDFMHIEKNVCDNIVNTLLNTKKSKDNKAAREDLVEMRIRLALGPQKKGERTFLPTAVHTLSTDEKKAFCKCLRGVKVPEGYSSNISNCVSVSGLKLTGLKSHDCHALMQQLLPVAIRSILPQNVRYAISRFCFFFHAICNKVIDPNDAEKLEALIITSLCEFEMYFPPAFFTIMVHLTVHLVREVLYLGPVYLRYQYPFERLMKVYKDYTSNRYRPEGCIAERAIIDEALSYCYDHLSTNELIGLPQNKHSGWIDGKGLRGRVRRQMTSKIRLLAHTYVLHNNEDEVEPYIERHKCDLKERNKGKTEKWITNEHHKKFAEWFKLRVMEERAECPAQISDRLVQLALGPSVVATTYSAYAIDGVTFYTKSEDEFSTMQNSGICLEAEAMYFASSKDKRPILGKMHYYGYIEDIWVLDYTDFRIPLFRCKWVDINNGVRKDDLGFTLVNFATIGSQTDPFILASQAKQVFYVTDPVDAMWSVVLSVRGRRTHGSIDDDVEFEGLYDAIPKTDEAETPNKFTRDDHGEVIWVTG